MQIYYINLDRDIARHARMEAQLERIGLRAERVAALTPTDVDATLIASNCDTARPHFVSPAELACTLSHQRAWRHMLDAGLPYALFLEDDVLLSTRLPEFLAGAVGHLAAIDVLRVETNLPQVRLGPAEGQIGQLATIHVMHSKNHGAGGYILNRRAAENLLSGLCSLDVPVDATLAFLRSPAKKVLTIRQANPAPVANGPAMIALVGDTGDSNLRQSRGARMELVHQRFETTVNYRFWHTGWRRRPHKAYLQIRDGIRMAFDRSFRGVREDHIPLL